ncbi:zinc ribbon domain-containing protein [Microcoleus sp. S13_C5]|uniref:zinc ribbon domain-containing protein n=1 Tax=Microcoleus sp. S13_C5 TaxID=3055411 RepID=UPI00403F2500
MFGVVTIAVPPHYISQNCSKCGELIKKSLSQRTHRCHHCGFVLLRDWNAAINILELALRTVGHMGTLNASGDIDKSICEGTPQCKSSRGKRKPQK